VPSYSPAERKHLGERKAQSPLDLSKENKGLLIRSRGEKPSLSRESPTATKGETCKAEIKGKEPRTFTLEEKVKGRGNGRQEKNARKNFQEQRKIWSPLRLRL